jgi:threonine synthase
VVVLATEHPAKEGRIIMEATGQAVKQPERFAKLQQEADPIALIDPQIDALEGAIASCL